MGEEPLYIADRRAPRALRISLTRSPPPPKDPPRILGIGLRKGPAGMRFLVREVPL